MKYSHDGLDVAFKGWRKILAIEVKKYLQEQVQCLEEASQDLLVVFVSINELVGSLY